MIGLKPDGEAQNWHQKEEPFEKMDVEGLHKTRAMTWSLPAEGDGGMTSPDGRSTGK
jgi:hypothetical protein